MRVAQEEGTNQRAGCDQVDQREQNGRRLDSGCLSKGSVLGPELRQRIPWSRELEEDPLRNHHSTLMKRVKLVTFLLIYL